MNKTYIEFFYPGSFYSETTTKEVPDRTQPTDVPKGAYGYRFFSQVKVEYDGEMLRSKAKDYSGTTFFGEALTLDDVAKLPDTKILQANMRNNGWSKVVRTAWGNFYPLEERDTVISPALMDKEAKS